MFLVCKEILLEALVSSLPNSSSLTLQSTRLNPHPHPHSAPIVPSYTDRFDEPCIKFGGCLQNPQALGLMNPQLQISLAYLKKKALYDGITPIDNLGKE